MCSMPPEFSALAELLPVTAERDFPVPLTVGVISATGRSEVGIVPYEN